MKKCLVLVLGVPVLALAACGGSSSPSSEDQITSVIKDVSNNPGSLCTKYATAELLTQAGGKAACVTASQAPDAKNPDTKIDSVSVDGDKATATITGTSGQNTIGFVKQDGKWMVDSSK